MTTEDRKREIDEAIYAGENALSAINEAENHLASARGLGIWDMLGGGLISGFLKHNRLDEAQACTNRAQLALERFQKELSDVNMSINYGVQFDTFTKAIDIVFDNFLVDAVIQSKIKETQRKLKDTEKQVRQALNDLHHLRNTII